jgi:hypothetical protein
MKLERLPEYVTSVVTVSGIAAVICASVSAHLMVPEFSTVNPPHEFR